jgi:hypothetical protein
VLYDQVFEGLEQLPLAFKDMEERKAWGKAYVKHPQGQSRASARARL